MAVFVIAPNQDNVADGNRKVVKPGRHQTDTEQESSWSSPRDTEDSKMSKKAIEHHKKAQEHHSHAARHHGEAAKHHEAGHHEKAAHQAHLARAHAIHARGHSEHATIAHHEEHGSK
jgi:hypothetical protein